MNEDYRDLRRLMYIRANECCEVCGKPLRDSFELAHRIPQRKHWIEKYGAAIIHHPLNMRVTCPGACNDAVSLGNNDHLHQQVIQEIEENDYGIDIWRPPY